MRNQIKILILGWMILTSWSLRAESLYLKNLFFESPGLTLQERLLGRNCYSLMSSSWGASCLAASLAQESKAVFRTNFIADQYLGDIVESSIRFKKPNPLELIQFLGRNSGVPDSSYFMGSLWYQSDKGWLISYTPLKGGMVSYLRNSALTEVTTHIFSESELTFKKGFVLESHPQWSAGWELKRRETQFLRGQFLLIDALAEPSKYLQPQQEVTVFLDPSLKYHFNNEQNSSLSLQLHNLKIHSSSSEPAHRFSIELGFASQFYLSDKLVRQSIHFSTRPDLISLRDRISWGFIYDLFAHGSITASLAGQNISLGYMGAIDSLTWGLGWESERLTINNYQFNQVNRLVAEIGLKF